MAKPPVHFTYCRCINPVMDYLLLITMAVSEFRILYLRNSNILRIIEYKTQDIVVLSDCQALDFKKIQTRGHMLWINLWNG
jgi:hypothetical protein